MYKQEQTMNKQTETMYNQLKYAGIMHKITQSRLVYA